MLRYLDRLGILPGTVIHVVAKEPFNGPLRLQIDQTEHFVGLEVAGQCICQPSDDIIFIPLEPIQICVTPI